MYKMKILIFIILFLISKTSSHYIGHPVIWERIPQFEVKTRVVSFLRTNDIANCFEYEENDEHLYLKCWSNDKLLNVEISIDSTRRSDSAYI